MFNIHQKRDQESFHLWKLFHQVIHTRHVVPVLTHQSFKLTASHRGESPERRAYRRFSFIKAKNDTKCATCNIN